MQRSVSTLALPDAIPWPLLSGSKAGPWRIEAELRQDRHGRTYAVVNEQTGIEATLKVFDAPALVLGSYSERIVAVAQEVNQLRHPGVVQVFDLGTLADGRPCIVMERLGGLTLHQLACLGRMSLDRALGILLAICDPLIAGHAAGTVHRDLTVETVLLVDRHPARPRVKLLDWGIAKALADEARRAGKVLLARPQCVAPEQAAGSRAPEIDIYALGVIAHQLLLGRLPTEQAEDDAELPPALAELLEEMLATDPRWRPTSRQVARRLEAIRSGDEPEVVIPMRQPRPHGRRMWPAAAVATACAAAAALFVVAGTADRNVPRSAALAARPQPVAELSAPVAPPSPSPVVEVEVAKARPIAPPVRPTRAKGVQTRAVRTAATPRRAAPAPTTVVAPVERPSRPVARVTAPSASQELALLTQYQRVGHALNTLARQRGTAAISELQARFKSIRIHEAAATVKTRAATAATLAEIQATIERNKVVEVSDECMNNPLARGCE